LPPNAPLVFLDRRPAELDACLISCDTAGATRDLCRHLIGLGHDRIAIIGGMPGLATWRNRVAGYRQAMREAGRPEDEDLVAHGNYRADGGAEAIRRLMASPRPPGAVIAASAQVLYGVLEELAEQGRLVPSDVAVSCVDDPALPSFVRPRFTYVEQPGYEMGDGGSRGHPCQPSGRQCGPRRARVPGETPCGRKLRRSRDTGHRHARLATSPIG
jgi:LacI family transcriptional regulator